MDFYWIKTNKIIKKLFSNQVWDIPNTENKVYLTFDDGPTPEVTEWVLTVLQKNKIKATFFCIGDNIRKYPALFQKVISEGHSVGNHTFNHLQGWKTTDKVYLENTSRCDEEIHNSDTNRLLSNIFRPPYGKIRLSQSAKLRKKGYKIIMWDVLSADFDTKISKEQCLENVIKNTTQGSIIVFHDSKKAFQNLEYALPRAIEFLKEKGFQFGKIV
ncbi:polysaccharide deacetylase family protein [Flavobacterium enshiense]|uniref:polysaccharide deacetylase family protein n=1 Tax=Flavobacterium enshiense TaxID=1341165 RepID=UPI00345CE5A0